MSGDNLGIVLLVAVLAVISFFGLSFGLALGNGVIFVVGVVALIYMFIALFATDTNTK